MGPSVFADIHIPPQLDQVNFRGHGYDSISCIKVDDHLDQRHYYFDQLLLQIGAEHLTYYKENILESEDVVVTDFRCSYSFPLFHLIIQIDHVKLIEERVLYAVERMVVRAICHNSAVQYSRVVLGPIGTPAPEQWLGSDFSC